MLQDAEAGPTVDDVQATETVSTTTGCDDRVACTQFVTYCRPIGTEHHAR